VKPVLLVIAGPNGSGKTTVTVRLQQDHWSEGVEYLISTSDPRINAARVADRVMLGGHTVPIEKIISRYGKSMVNLLSAIRLADRVYIYDNSVDFIDARLCARTQDGALRKVYGDLPAWVAAVIEPLPRHADFVDLR
jgi:predicted ABC-type ATPase